jgi:hypothetical protein
MSPWLSPEEVEELTDRKRWSAQCRALAGMGIPFRPNAVGRPLVERTAVLSGPKRERVRTVPNWDAIDGPKKAA